MCRVDGRTLICVFSLIFYFQWHHQMILSFQSTNGDGNVIFFILFLPVRSVWPSRPWRRWTAVTCSATTAAPSRSSMSTSTPTTETAPSSRRCCRASPAPRYDGYYCVVRMVMSRVCRWLALAFCGCGNDLNTFQPAYFHFSSILMIRRVWKM